MMIGTIAATTAISILWIGLSSSFVFSFRVVWVANDITHLTRAESFRVCIAFACERWVLRFWIINRFLSREVSWFSQNNVVLALSFLVLVSGFGGLCGWSRSSHANYIYLLMGLFPAESLWCSSLDWSSIIKIIIGVRPLVRSWLCLCSLDFFFLNNWFFLLDHILLLILINFRIVHAISHSTAQASFLIWVQRSVFKFFVLDLLCRVATDIWIFRFSNLLFLDWLERISNIFSLIMELLGICLGTFNVIGIEWSAHVLSRLRPLGRTGTFYVRSDVWLLFNGFLNFDRVVIKHLLHSLTTSQSDVFLSTCTSLATCNKLVIVWDSHFLCLRSLDSCTGNLSFIIFNDYAYFLRWWCRWPDSSNVSRLLNLTFNAGRCLLSGTSGVSDLWEANLLRRWCNWSHAGWNWFVDLLIHFCE